MLAFSRKNEADIVLTWAYAMHSEARSTFEQSFINRWEMYMRDVSKKFYRHNVDGEDTAGEANMVKFDAPTLSVIYSKLRPEDKMSQGIYLKK